MHKISQNLTNLYNLIQNYLGIVKARNPSVYKGLRAFYMWQGQKDSKKRPAEIHSHDEFSGCFFVEF